MIFDFTDHCKVSLCLQSNCCCPDRREPFRFGQVGGIAVESNHQFKRILFVLFYLVSLKCYCNSALLEVTLKFLIQFDHI
jgi:hypothetical protein